jgi:proteasome accessory factor C
MSKKPAEVRLARLLAIVPWISARDGPQVEEVCRRFGVEEGELLEDLNLLFMCGVHPFTPDVLIDVNVADGRVWISMADYFRRPLRFNAEEGLALASVATAFLKIPGSDPDGVLATALDKLLNVLGVGADEALDVDLEPVAGEVLDTVRRAASGQRKVSIDYYSFGRDGHSTRVVQPWKVFNAAGQWYMSGWCETAVAERLFRVDRITRASPTGDTFERAAPEAGAGPELYHPAADDPTVVLDLDPRARWIAEQYPNDTVVARPDGVLRVTLRSGQRPWLERLLLRAGPAVRVIEGDTGLGPEAARRLLARYRGSTGVG